MRVNGLALERVCKILDIDFTRGFREIIFANSEVDIGMHAGVCTLDHETGEIWVVIDPDLSIDQANHVALHELKHVAQEIHEGAQSQGKYADQARALDLDPVGVMAIDRREALTPQEAERYVQIPYEKEAANFAYLHEDLYQVIVP